MSNKNIYQVTDFSQLKLIVSKNLTVIIGMLCPSNTKEDMFMIKKFLKSKAKLYPLIQFIYMNLTEKQIKENKQKLSLISDDYDDYPMIYHVRDGNKILCSAKGVDTEIAYESFASIAPYYHNDMEEFKRNADATKSDRANKTGKNSKLKSKSKPNSESKSKPKSMSKSMPKTKPKSMPKSELKTELNSEPKSEPSAVSKSVSKSQPDSGSKSEHNTELETEHKNNKSSEATNGNVFDDSDTEIDISNTQIKSVTDGDVVDTCAQNLNDDNTVTELDPLTKAEIEKEQYKSIEKYYDQTCKNLIDEVKQRIKFENVRDSKSDDEKEQIQGRRKKHKKSNTKSDSHTEDANNKTNKTNKTDNANMKHVQKAQHDQIGSSIEKSSHSKRRSMRKR